MNIKWKNVKEFFMKNGKKWVATSITTLMLTQPIMAKTESSPSVNNDMVKSITVHNKNNDTLFNGLSGLEDIINNDKVLVENTSDIIFDSLNEYSVFKFYDIWKKDSSNKYVRKVYTINVDLSYFENHSYEDLLVSIKHAKMDGITAAQNVEIETSVTEPNDYEYLSLEIDGVGVIFKTKSTNYTSKGNVNTYLLASSIITLFIGSTLGVLKYNKKNNNK